MLKYERNYRLEVQDVNGDFQVIQYPLTLDFTVTRNTMGGIQQGDFTVFNLGDNTRKLVNKNTIDFSPNNIRQIRWYAGYGPTNLPLVFEGQVLTCNSVREEGSTEWQTNFACQDPGLLPTASVSLPVTSSLSKKESVSQLVNLMNRKAGAKVKLGLVGKIFDENPKFLRDNSFNGNYMQILGQLTGGNLSGGNYYFENQILNLLQQNEVFENDGLTTLSVDQGLLGAPYYEQTWIFANMIFEPRIKMGQLLTLKSKDQPWLNGQKKVVAYEHTGTISGALAGAAKTQIQLFATLNSQGFQIIGGGPPPL
ncbi:MAG TPA: hypothetical protein VMT55_00130 [Candidatus Sulfotelmatobacter sp.]|nr:hypothetical protein [Candidatus Sulfotelmatobacter sp.]